MLKETYRQALASSRLSFLPDDTLEALTVGSTVVDVPASGVFHRLGSTDAFTCVVVSGLVRAFVTSPEGRQMTVRYSRAGDIVGAATLFTRAVPNVHHQAVTEARVLVMVPSTLGALARTDIAMANVLQEELAERASSYLGALTSATLSPLKLNVVRHLLDLAIRDDHDHHLVARLSQQELADSVGTVREVIGRILHNLKEEGLLLTRRDEIELLDVERLRDMTWPPVR